MTILATGHITRPRPPRPPKPERICHAPFACDCPRCSDDDPRPTPTTKKAA